MVIVKRWDANTNKNALRTISQNELKHFDNSDNGKKAYIAIKDDKYENEKPIIVGNSMTTPMERRKRSNVREYQNAPLSENTQYAIFIRVFYDKDGVSYILRQFLLWCVVAIFFELFVIVPALLEKLYNIYLPR